MWIPKTPHELKEEAKERYSFKVPLFISAIIFLFQLFKDIIKQLTRKGNLILDFERIFGILILSMIGGIIIYALMLLNNRKNKVIQIFNKQLTVICLTCHEKKVHNNDMKCKCGGKFEFLQNMKWVE